MAIDYGERRLGLALCDEACILATPYRTIDTRQETDPVAAITETVGDENIGLILIGYPLHLDGRVSEKAVAVDAFIRKLSDALPGMKIDRADEAYTSVQAAGFLAQRKKNRRKRPDKAAIDRLAAAILLQEYLDENPGLSL